MKNRGLLIFLLFLPLLVLTLWAGELELRYIMSPKIYVSATGYDPRDLLSGRYLNLQLQWDNTDCSQFKDQKCHEDRFTKTYRYYLPEADAIRLDRVVMQRKINLMLEFAYPKNGAPIIRELLIDGKNWKTWTYENP